MLVRRDLEEFVQVPEGLIHFEKRGSGTPLVLFHLLGTSTWDWHKVMEPLGQHFTCYAFDMPGHGQSDAPGEDLTIPDLARSVDHAMQVMNIHRAHIIGNSVGSILAAGLAASYPDRVDRLVLAGTPVRDPFNAPQLLERTAAAYDENNMPLPFTLERLKTATIFVNPEPEWMEKVNELHALAGIWVRKIQEALLSYDLLARLSRIQASATLVLYGEHDRLRGGADLLRYNIPNASKKFLPGVGHLPQIEAPEDYVSTVLDFLK